MHCRPIRNVFAEGELTPESVVKDFFTTAADGKQYRTKHYSLNVILSRYRRPTSADYCPALP